MRISVSVKYGLIYLPWMHSANSPSLHLSIWDMATDKLDTLHSIITDTTVVVLFNPISSICPGLTEEYLWQKIYFSSNCHAFLKE